MKVSESWLRELVNPPVNTETLVEQVTMAGLEVDAVEPAAGEFSNVVVAQVESISQHPNADKLKVCQVNVGDSEPLQIVCGASNVREGLKIPAALIGAVLPGDFKIKKSKLRGELSMGMLCSEKELGLADDADGLMELAKDAPVGADVKEYLQLDDSIIELDLTPNRADCLSVEGIAREVSVLNKTDWTPVSVSPSSIMHDESLSVDIHEPEACPAYLGRLVKDVNATSSTPVWMQEKLRRCGLRSLGPLIDVTNYVLLELGQPLHAFDAAKLTGSIVVRKSQPQEKLALLNDQTIELDGEALVIADEKQALALAGVMGGSDSAVSDDTTSIFLECAYFNPVLIAGKARSFGLHTDSSHRFERGVDFTLQRRAIERATQLITEICGGQVGPITEHIDESALPERTAVILRKPRIASMLGAEIADQQIEQILSGLGMQIEHVNDGWKVTPPGYRFDIAIEADLLEEIARIYGYNNLPNKSLLMRSALGQAPETLVPLDRAKDLLVDKGYQETISYSFVAEELQKTIAPDDRFIALKNPISSDLAVMRTTLWCGLITSALYNINRQQPRVRIFESGLRFIQVQGETKQEPMLSGLVTGNVLEEQWAEKSRKVDFFDVKADLEALFYMSAQPINFVAEIHPALHPGQTARLYDKQAKAIGWLGMLHPSLEQQLGFDNQVFLFELELQAILESRAAKFQPLSKFPFVKRDLAVLVKEDITVDQIINSVHECGEKTIQSVRIFDIYRGQGVEPGYKSVALSLTLQDPSQTLEDSVIDAIFSHVLQSLKSDINATLRE